MCTPTSRRRGPARLQQVLYHLQKRAIVHAALPWCEQHGVAMVVYSPFGRGIFPGPHTPGGRVLAQIAAAHNARPARSRSASW